MLTVPPAPARTIAGLKDALDLLRARSADLRVAYLEVERAEAQSRSALGALLPQVNGQAGVTHQLITRDTLQPNQTTVKTPAENSASFGVSATQSVFSLPLIRARANAKMNEEVQRLSLEDQKRALLAGVITSAVAVSTAERVAALNRIGLRSALERYEIAKTKERLGSANKLDTKRAEQDVENARSQVVNGDESLKQSREALALAVGVTGEMGVGPAMDPAQLLLDAGQLCNVVGTVEERADIRSQEKKVELGVRGIDDVKAQFLPTVGLSSNLQTSLSTVTVSAPTTWSVGANLTLPIWDGGNRYGQLHQAEAQAEENRVQLDATKRGVVTGAAQARRAIDVATETRAVAERAQKLATEIDLLVQTSYRMGQGTSLDLVTAATAKRQADINLALADFAVARARLTDRLTLASCKY
jgi:outer membrane protein TolC